MNLLRLFLLLAGLYPNIIQCKRYDGIHRTKCDTDEQTKIKIKNDNNITRRLSLLREHMQLRVSLIGPEIDAYIITSFDEHLNENLQEFDERHIFISGFTGSFATIVVTLKSTALWTDDRFISLANQELDCEWNIFKSGESPTISEWLAQELQADARVGSDPKMVPHSTWIKWEKKMNEKSLRLVPIKNNLVDLVWKTNRPEPRQFSIRVHPQMYAGEKWQSKLQRLRKALSSHEVDAMVVTSLTEIAYLLNLRGFDIPFIPVFKAYMIITHNEAYLYTNKTKITLGIELHLKLKECSENCIYLKKYEDIFDDIRTFSQKWRRVLVPAPSTFDHGASEAIYSAFHDGMVFEKVSPVIYMRAQKNEVEREGMKRAHIRDAAAMCDVFAYLEQKHLNGDRFTELSLSAKIDSIRLSTNFSRGLSLPTIVAVGVHASEPYYMPNNQTNSEITDKHVILIESGGQYIDGTTDVSRTIHLGEPTQEEQKVYTNVLIGLIRLSMLEFPANMRPAGIDAIARGPQWTFGNDYAHGTGHGIGSYSSVYESPANIAFNNHNNHPFKEGYFFTTEPAFYRPGYFGVRLENVVEVIDTGKVHPNGEKFLAIKDATLVPFEPKLIDRSMMSAPEKKWLNDYNARIREEVGKYLKETIRNEAFYWMMNKTQHVIEYLPESDYKSIGGTNCFITSFGIVFIGLLLNYF